MIPIKIDNENIDFRDLHFSKVKTSIQELVRNRLNDLLNTSFEYKALNWIEWHLDFILKEEPNKLRELIKSFNNFIQYFVATASLTITSDRMFTIEKLKQICRENNINGFSSKNKEELICLVNSEESLIGETIDNLKYLTLSNKINSILKEIFEDFYEKKWDEIDGYDRYDFVDKHNLKTCPYCNMGYILISKIDRNNTNGLRPEIDHFFPKSKYPYLAMSFYNLIPSCKVCNHTKGSKDTYEDELLSPYEINDNTFQITYRPNKMNFYQIKKRKYKSYNFEIEFKKIDNHTNKYFKLDKLYEQHKDVVLELLVKKTIYSKSYIAELKKNFNFTDDEIYRFLFCNYKESKEFSKRPLSKLIKDISSELGLV